MNDRFVCVWKNIRPSQPMQDGMYGKDNTEQLTKLANGTADNNIATLVTTVDERVVHVIPGFWKPVEYVKELEFGLTLTAKRDETLKSAHESRSADVSRAQAEGAALLLAVHNKLKESSLTLADFQGINAGLSK